MQRILLCTGILQRESCVLLVASRYPNRAEPLWGLPGGRPRPGELLRDALVRECSEETGLNVVPGALAYISESFDLSTNTHVLNATFDVQARGDPRAAERDAHVVGVAWVPVAEIAERISVGVVGEPLIAYLSGNPQRYYGFADAGITIEFADEP